MTPSRAQLDTAEARLLKEWRGNVMSPATREWFRKRGLRDEPSPLRTSRDVIATCIRAIRAQRKALDAEATAASSCGTEARVREHAITSRQAAQSARRE